MAATTTGAAQWGVAFTAAGITGVLTDCEVGNEPVTANQLNELGAVIRTVMYDLHQTVTGTLEVAPAFTLPTLPAQATVGGVQGMITSARLVESNNAFRKYLVTVEAWTNCNSMTSAS